MLAPHMGQQLPRVIECLLTPCVCLSALWNLEPVHVALLAFVCTPNVSVDMLRAHVLFEVVPSTVNALKPLPT